MNYKAKSFLYFASLVIAIVSYYNIDNTSDVQNTELAENTIENVSTLETIN
ncbi:hypothetical protein [Maribacter algarum]|uniref:hypothetical protein n=1 Tax=Maribacter algarum (ex Zhang et al. 2020) TaxID=2578118 RepID=UPI00148724F2|nr:hypothetical protein [Maribacter algarum]